MVQSVQAKGKYRQAILATAGILAFFGSSIAAYAQSVVVQGNKRVETETIRSYVTDQSPDQAKRDLMQTGLFSNV